MRPFLILCEKYPGYTTLDAVEYARSHYYTQKDIQKFLDSFSVFLGIDDVHVVAGFFLSALINECKQDNLVLSVKNAPGISVLGYRNTRNFTINGDVGDQTGLDSISGSITINGNSGLVLGYFMTGGTLTINGNAGRYLGSHMKGGKITVNGNTEIETARCMHDGEIMVNGKIESLSVDIRGGNVFQFDCQIVKNGHEMGQIKNK